MVWNGLRRSRKALPATFSQSLFSGVKDAPAQHAMLTFRTFLGANFQNFEKLSGFFSQLK
jgi:hypothetical protein